VAETPRGMAGALGMPERLAAAAPRAELVVYETGNHVCTNPYWRHTPMEADWLAAQLWGL
jgi:hypothetical protein